MERPFSWRTAALGTVRTLLISSVTTVARTVCPSLSRGSDLPTTTVT